jgi:hypothetical protein
MTRSFLLALLFALSACATPLHLRPVPLTNGGRTLPALFMGGWDGHRLDLVDDTSIEPGTTRVEELTRALAKLSANEYGVIFVESARLNAEVTAPHALFCQTTNCVVVIDRHKSEHLADWGPALAIFELTGPHDDVVGSIWMDGGVIRPPGPKSWPQQCRNPTDPPQRVHPDGNGVFPVRSSGTGVGFALFGPSDVASAYRREGFPAPVENGCVREVPKEAAPPATAPTPAVAPAKPTTPAQEDSSSPSKRSRRHRRKRDSD